MEGTNDDPNGGVVQVLNIVVSEARLLSSRERCPFLVRLEVADTGLEGSDARLYASEGPRMGLTVAEALCTRMPSNATDNVGQTSHDRCQVPFELVGPTSTHSETNSPNQTLNLNGNPTTGTGGFPRGGWQIEADGTDYMNAGPYHAVRENEYEQLHQHLQSSQGQQAPVPAETVAR